MRLSSHQEMLLGKTTMKWSKKIVLVVLSVVLLPAEDFAWCFSFWNTDRPTWPTNNQGADYQRPAYNLTSARRMTFCLGGGRGLHVW